MKHTLLCLSLLALASLLSACPTPDPIAPPLPEDALRPGLVRLVPYDFLGRSPQGVLWLENFASAHPGTPEASAARRELLRVRLDWLTVAYLQEDRQQRLTLLFALMDELGTPHEAVFTAEGFNALLDALERQIQGIQSDPEAAQMVASARDLLTLFRNLDQGEVYFKTLVTMREALRQDLDDGSLDPHGRAAFAPGALLVAMFDLDNNLSQLSKVQPEQVSHALASMSPYACPAGMLAYAEASAETRVEVLRQHCGMPCSENPPLPMNTLSKDCAQELMGTSRLVDFDNEVMLRSLHDMARILTEGNSLLALPSGPPLVDAVREHAARQTRALEAGLFTLQIPETAMELPVVEGLPAPGVLPVVLSVQPAGLWISTHPMASMEGGKVHVGTASEALTPYLYPGQPVYQDAEGALEALRADEGHLLSRVHGLARIFEEALKLKKGSLDNKTLVPALMVHRGQSVEHLLTQLKVLSKGSFKRVDVLSWQPSITQVGALSVSFGDKVPVGSPPVLSISPTKYKWVQKGKQTVVSTFSVGKPPSLEHLHEAVETASRQSFDGSLDTLVLKLDPRTSMQAVLDVVGELRLKKEGDGVKLSISNIFVLLED